jgi:chromosome segregation ATPase
MRNPATGEEGTWIPRWAERAHVLDAHQLELCLKDVELADGQLDALEDRHTALAAALSDIEHARDEAEVATFAAEQLTKSHETQLERRLRAVWGLVGASVALGVATTILILR